MPVAPTTPGSPDERLLALRAWLHQLLSGTEPRLEPASADASFRRYFRAFLADGSTRIVMDAPPEREDSTGQFVKVAGLLRDAGKRVAVLRHPMPYGDLTQQVAQRFARYEDLDVADATIEEREGCLGPWRRAPAGGVVGVGWLIKRRSRRAK